MRLIPILLAFPTIFFAGNAWTDTISGKIFADNTFTLYVNGQQVAKDPITFTPHNTVEVRFQVDYPFVLAIRAEDHAHPQTGLEYKHSKIGDGGLIARFDNGVTTHSQWRCKVVSHGPVDRACLHNNPAQTCRVRNQSEPVAWTTPDFDDSDWRDTRPHSVAAVNPHGDFYHTDWGRAQFIWGPDLELDNVLLCRLTVQAPSQETPASSRTAANCADKLKAFEKFADHVKARCNADQLIIESDGLAEHAMMKGISAWNQQVPLPQQYSGNNAWRIPLHPHKAATPAPTWSTGPIAVAVNGVPIFDPSKQEGQHDAAHDPNLIGELDECGGHAGRADDYHYHRAPNCLLGRQAADRPVGYGLDGFPIYGYRNADGSAPHLDRCNGEADAFGNYHYHATPAYPYLMGCIVGDVDKNQQPRTRPIRPAGEPIEADISDFHILADRSHYRLTFSQRGDKHVWEYRKDTSSCWLFHFDEESTERYCSDTPGIIRQDERLQGRYDERQGGPQTRRDARSPRGERRGGSDKQASRNINNAAAKLGINADRLRRTLGTPPYDFRRTAEALNVDEGQLHDALGIPRPQMSFPTREGTK